MRLADQAAAREAATFVAREAELACLAELLSVDSSHRVAVATGAAGVGKTALLREVARRAEPHGYVVVWLDARELVVERTLDRVLAHAGSLRRPFLVIDSAEHLGDHERHLLETGLAALPDATRVALVSRCPVDATWWGSPWAPSIVSVPVGPLESRAGDRSA